VDQLIPPLLSAHQGTQPRLPRQVHRWTEGRLSCGDLHFHGTLLHLSEPRIFAAWLRTLFRHDWVVYAKRPFGGPEHALHYLGAYTHRVAISNRRLIALEDGNITFRWRDSAHGNKKKPMTLPVDEFLRRFLLHLLPRGFVRIRNFGFLANRRRASLLPLCRELLLASTENTAATVTRSASRSALLWRCPRCGSAMHMVERISAAQLLLRAPPLSIGALHEPPSPPPKTPCPLARTADPCLAAIPSC
jgi:hypothetical protein